MNGLLHDALRAACADVGIVYRDVPVDGRWHEADVDGDQRGRGDGRIKLFPDGEGGIVCNWKAGDLKAGDIRPFFVNDERRLSNAERCERDRKRDAAIRQAQQEQQRRRAEAAKKALMIWKTSSPAQDDHPYLSRKGVPAVATLREIDVDKAVAILGYPPKSGGELLAGRLLVVPVKIGNSLSTLELIDPAGLKSAIAGGAKAGGYWAAQPLPDHDGTGMTLLIGEGVATVLSAKEASGHPGIAALSCGNLLPVALAMHARYPAAKIEVIADIGNGYKDAEAAALAVGGLLAVPDFGSDRPEGATDFNDMAAHKGREAVERAIANAKPPAVAQAQPVPANATAADRMGRKWPDEIAPEALHGIVGEIVRMIEPNTEADPAAILAQTLVAFGAYVARASHVRVEGDRHYTNLFLVVVGGTSKGRKGTSWSRVRQIFERVALWKPTVSGLSSGEGLKYNVRDPVEKTTQDESHEIVTQIVDEGVTDKRLLVIESEFAQALRATQRHGNTLSATIREAWDTGRLATLTKNDPITATNAHICIIGHITADELRAELTATDSANGFANRFLYVAAKRSKVLPFGGADADDHVLDDVAARLTRLAELAGTRGAIEMDPMARKLWASIYPKLSEGSPGLFGAVTARAEAQCLRLALLYALLDGADHIGVAHLTAAVAIWEYCEATARYVFGDSLGDRVADEILRSLRMAGLGGRTRTELRDLFGRHQTAERIGQALTLLKDRGLAKVEQRQTGGRPEETWTAA